MVPNLLNLDLCLGFRFMMFYRQITQHPTEIGVTRPSPRLANGDRSLRGSAKSAASPAIVTWRSSGTCRMGPVMFNRRAPKGPLSNEGVKTTADGLGMFRSLVDTFRPNFVELQLEPPKRPPLLTTCSWLSATVN